MALCVFIPYFVFFYILPPLRSFSSFGPKLAGKIIPFLLELFNLSLYLRIIPNKCKSYPVSNTNAGPHSAGGQEAERRSGQVSSDQMGQVGGGISSILIGRAPALLRSHWSKASE